MHSAPCSFYLNPQDKSDSILTAKRLGQFHRLKYSSEGGSERLVQQSKKVKRSQFCLRIG